MKSLIAMTLLAGAFLGGYYLGQQPGSPDMFAWAGKACDQAERLGEIVHANQAAPSAPPAQSVQPLQAVASNCAPPAGALIEIGGQTYRVGVQPQ